LVGRGLDYEFVIAATVAGKGQFVDWPHTRTTGLSIKSTIDNGRASIMTVLKSLSLALAGVCVSATTLSACADVSNDIGVEPVCPYGYYDAAPYACAPSGYYGPEWFTGGVFLGAGPWFRGHDDFLGHVDNRFHPDHGYRGAMPQRGERADPSRHLDHMAHFQGNEVRDGRGHIGGGHGGRR
jgi:hypothetical protein